MFRSRLDTTVFRVLLGVIVLVVLLYEVPIRLEKYRHDREYQFVDAAYRGDTPAVISFLKSGISPNVTAHVPHITAIQNSQICSALEAATSASRYETATVLLEHGATRTPLAMSFITASPSPQLALYATAHGTPPAQMLDLAIQSRNATLVRELFQHYPALKAETINKSDWLLNAATRGDVDIIQALLEAGFYVDVRDGFGSTALMHAAMVGGTDTVEYLLSQGANLYAKNRYGYDALYYAKLQHHSGTANAIADARKQAASINRDLLARTYPLLATGEVDEAKVLIQKALRKDPHDVVAHLLTGYVLILQREYQAAIPELHIALKQLSRRADVHNYLGLALFYSSHPDASFTEFREAIKREGNRIRYRHDLASALETTGHVKEAVEEYRRIVDIYPKNQEAIGWYARSLQFAGRNDDAIAQIKKGLDINSANSDLHNLYGTVLINKGQREAGIQEKLLAQHYSPNNPNYHFELSTWYFTFGRTSEAIQEARNAVDISPQYGLGWVNLGWYLICAGKIDEAAAACYKAVELLPKSSNAHANLGKALTLQKKYPEALASCKTALSLDANNAEAHYYLADALHKSGDRAAAKHEFEAYLSMPKKQAQETGRVQSAKEILKSL